MPDDPPSPAVIPTSTPPALWTKLKPLAREMRREPTAAEKTLWQNLRGRQIAGCKFRRQHTIERFVVDLFCSEARLIIEVDGPIHQYTPEEDAVRQEYLESLGFRVLRFTNDDVLSRLNKVLEAIRRCLADQSPA